ncbi:chloride channel protein [Halpernia frigidisoli]|uniref:H+/Cl-antiporter ClcA n=1 Tax=Halpernia frigidisoli TaxID=1125876 RepID=A0A1I3FVR9_9FLAO|nr:chloride channel protein [Halpernia frigidisoli]SFI15289.1 H+/Cl-antiporter ClcA [Halpernia frigidisoli]
MQKSNLLNDGIPISPSLHSTLIAENFVTRKGENKKRILIISGLALLLGICVSLIAKFLILLLNLITNISFYSRFSLEHATPVGNSLGIFVIIIPAIGGIIVGFMTIYGSKAIRGHGIPEAMEQILTNESKIKPAITYLKPLSSAIAIGTGGPFGAEGPIIATGAALGSTLGQILKISDNERKILLAAGATAGMAAIFGSPIASIFLAIELLLFEFSARSIIPVAIACITGAAGHHLLFGANPVFEMPKMAIPSNFALFAYSMMGIIIGVLSVGVSKIVYLVEENFEKLPVHFFWFPAIGGLVVGVTGYFAPETLGVGYENITNILSGNLTLSVVLSLCFLKFISWAIALGSGTSGGTLAPLLTIGGAVGVLLGMGIKLIFPQSGVLIPLAALVGMAAMFAGSSRALLTSIIFALETTGQSSALLPLLGACLAAYVVSFFLMENTIMTEKIARRGVRTPTSYEPDLLEKLTVNKVLKSVGMVINEHETIKNIKEQLYLEKGEQQNYFVIANNEGEYKGTVSFSTIFDTNNSDEDEVKSLLKGNYVTINLNDSLLTAAETMAKENTDVLPVVNNKTIVGIVSYRDILSCYKQGISTHEMKNPNISLKRKSYKMLIRGQKLVHKFRKN